MLEVQTVQRPAEDVKDGLLLELAFALHRQVEAKRALDLGNLGLMRNVDTGVRC